MAAPTPLTSLTAMAELTPAALAVFQGRLRAIAFRVDTRSAAPVARGRPAHAYLHPDPIAGSIEIWPAPAAA